MLGGGLIDDMELNPVEKHKVNLLGVLQLLNEAGGGFMINDFDCSVINGA